MLRPVAVPAPWKALHERSAARRSSCSDQERCRNVLCVHRYQAVSELGSEYVSGCISEFVSGVVLQLASEFVNELFPELSFGLASRWQVALNVGGWVIVLMFLCHRHNNRLIEGFRVIVVRKLVLVLLYCLGPFLDLPFRDAVIVRGYSFQANLGFLRL